MQRALLLSTLLLAACGTKAPPPEDTLATFLDAHIAGDRGAAYALLSTADQATMTAEHYLSTRTKTEIGATALMDRKSSYAIGEVSRADPSATIGVTISTPDPKLILKDMLGASFAAAMRGEESPQDKRAIERIRSGDLPMMSIDRDYHLLLEEGAWRVHLDLAPS